MGVKYAYNERLLRGICHFKFEIFADSQSHMPWDLPKRAMVLLYELYVVIWTHGYPTFPIHACITFQNWTLDQEPGTTIQLDWPNSRREHVNEHTNLPNVDSSEGSYLLLLKTT